MNLVDCTEHLLRSEICVVPTETVYGLACSAFSVAAVKKVFELKGRPANNPLIVHVLNHDSADEICKTNELSVKLAKAFWPGALTLVLPKKKCIPLEVTSGRNSVAVRSPSHPLFRQIITRAKIPIAAPSANLANKISPTNYQDVLDAFGDKCPPILDGGECDFGIESTVLDLTTTIPQILRFGPVTKQDIENVLGFNIEFSSTGTSNEKDLFSGKKSPGQGSKHYAPDTPLNLHSSIEKMFSSETIKAGDVVILPCPKTPHRSLSKKPIILYLSESGKTKDIAKSLYKILRQADKLLVNKIHISLFPLEDDLISAINDKLYRASTCQL